MSKRAKKTKEVTILHEVYTEEGFPIPHPRNCSDECVYGKGREFCWPCYKKIVSSMRTVERG